MDVCPSGHLDRDSIMDMYSMPRRNAKIFIDQMFRLFDRDGDGTINFRVRTIGHSDIINLTLRNLCLPLT